MRENPTEIQIPDNALGLLSRKSTVEKYFWGSKKSKDLFCFKREIQS